MICIDAEAFYKQRIKIRIYSEQLTKKNVEKVVAQLKYTSIGYIDTSAALLTSSIEFRLPHPVGCRLNKILEL